MLVPPRGQQARRDGRVRQQLDALKPGEPRCIRTVRNAGYMFVPNSQ